MRGRRRRRAPCLFPARFFSRTIASAPRLAPGSSGRPPAASCPIRHRAGPSPGCSPARRRCDDRSSRACSLEDSMPIASPNGPRAATGDSASGEHDSEDFPSALSPRQNAPASRAWEPLATALQSPVLPAASGQPGQPPSKRSSLSPDTPWTPSPVRTRAKPAARSTTRGPACDADSPSCRQNFVLSLWGLRCLAGDSRSSAVGTLVRLQPSSLSPGPPGQSQMNVVSPPDPGLPAFARSPALARSLQVPPPASISPKTQADVNHSGSQLHPPIAPFAIRPHPATPTDIRP